MGLLAVIWSVAALGNAPFNLEVELKNLNAADFADRSKAATALARLNEPEQIRKVVNELTTQLTCAKKKNINCHSSRYVYNVLTILKSYVQKEFQHSWSLVYELAGMGPCQGFENPGFFEYPACLKRPSPEGVDLADNCQAAMGGYRPTDENVSLNELQKLYAQVEAYTKPTEKWTARQIAARGGELEERFEGMNVWVYQRERRGSILPGCGRYDNYTWVMRGEKLLKSAPIALRSEITRKDAKLGSYLVGSYVVFNSDYSTETQPHYSFELIKIPSLQVICRAYVDDPIKIVKREATYEEALAQSLNLEAGECQAKNSKVKIEH